MLVGAVVWVIVVQSIGIPLRLPTAKWVPQRFYRLATRITGIKIVQRGEMTKARSTLFVANHCSYLDIFVLGGLISGAFVAKTEVRGWPVLGYMSTLGYTVYVDRRARYAKDQRDEMMARLEAGDNLILFPEGTSSDGHRTLPFKSALFSTAELRIDGKAITVQPVSIAYTHLDGMPLGRNLRAFYAWYGEMDLLSHIWRVLGLGRATATVEFHPPVTMDQFGSRKTLAAHCEDEVANGVSASLTGRAVPPAKVPAGAVASAAAPGPAQT